MLSVWRATVVLFVAMFALLIGPVSPACACSCADLSPQQAADAADLVFVGVVVRIDRPVLGMSSADELTARLVVESVSKGVAGPQVQVSTAIEGPSCGFDFVLGHRYQVYSTAGKTSLCAGNKELGAAPEVPLQDGPPATVLVAAGVGLAVLLTAGGWWFLRRRRRVGAQDSA